MENHLECHATSKEKEHWNDWCSSVVARLHDRRQHHCKAFKTWTYLHIFIHSRNKINIMCSYYAIFGLQSGQIWGLSGSNSFKLPRLMQAFHVVRIFVSGNLFLNVAFLCVHVSREDISNLASDQMAYKVEFIQHESAVQLPRRHDSWILRQRCLSTFLKGFSNARYCWADNQHSPLPSGRASVSERHRQTSKCLPPSKVMKEASVLFDHTARASSLR